MNFSHILKPIRLGAHTVPGIWRYILPEDVLYYRVDPEVGSSCFDCPQVKEHGFHPTIRCCAFMPRIPNFLLGLALFDAQCQETVEKFILGGFAIPEGSQTTPGQMQLSMEQIQEYPKIPKVICQFLDQDSKACRIYPFRNGVCSTFFCKHDRGDAGATFWESLQDLVSQIETALAQWALQENGFDLDAYFARFDSLASQLETCQDPQSLVWNQETRNYLFHNFAGQELELFRACGTVVVKHKKDLYQIARQQKLRQTTAYDTALRLQLSQVFAPHLIAESLPEGTPVSVDSIWYSTQLSYRNMQLSKQGNP